MDEKKFKEKIGQLCDPYFEREFFTNLIYCMDRKKTPRDIFEAVMQEISLTEKWSDTLDQALLQLFYATQAVSQLRENYQWLPLAQGIYSFALFRSLGDEPLLVKGEEAGESQACRIPEFKEMIHPSVRQVESRGQAWASFLFLLENRTTRMEVIQCVLRQAMNEVDSLTFQLLVKGFYMAQASGWKVTANILKRPWERFWNAPSSFQVHELEPLDDSQSQNHWEEGWCEELWSRLTLGAPSLAWDFIKQIVQKGAGLNSLIALMNLFYGRCLWSMPFEKWKKVTAGLLWSNALEQASFWLKEEQETILKIQTSHLASLVPSLGTSISPLPHVKSLPSTISNERIILRLDDAIERGAHEQAFSHLALLLEDQGFSNSLMDRILLSASKQDGWTFEQCTLPVVCILIQAYQATQRFNISTKIAKETLYGLVRFLCEERHISLALVPQTGTYGNSHGLNSHGLNGVSRSQYDVSEGARIVDRFVFNQLRNAQRIKIWPSDD